VARTGLRSLVALSLLAAALAAVATAGLAGPAQAGEFTFRFGVVNGVIPRAGDLEGMEAARAKSVRVTFNWDQMEVQRPSGGSCGTASYDFTRYDALVSAASDRGVRLLPYFLGSPPYARTGGDSPARYPVPGTSAMDAYKCWVRALVNRYGRGGTYFGTDPSALPIVEWQAWNEVNLRQYSPYGDVNPRRYAAFLKQTSGAIRSQDDRATIVLAGMPEEVAQETGMRIHGFLRQMYRVRGVRGAFDVVALHPYARDHRGVKGALIRLRDTLSDLNDGRRATWITEIGWGTGPGNHFLQVSEQQQAELLANTFAMLQANHTRFKVGTVHWYRWRDTAHYVEDAYWANYAGLYRQDGSPKPSCNRFRRATGADGSCTPLALGVEAAGDGARLEMHAAEGLVPSPPPNE
jgi:hypothetical protein